MTSRAATLLFALAAACGSSVEFGIPFRTPVQGLNFPTGLPQPQPLVAADAFPDLPDFAQPLFLTYAPDGTGRLFVVEQGGEIHVFPNDAAASSAKVFLDLPVSTAGSEEGLLGLAFHRDYAQNGWFYVYYSLASPRRTRLSRFTVSADPDAADPASEEILFEIAQPYSNHNGGMLAFGPDDMLYVAVGDGGDGGDPQDNAQRLDTPLGKVLRVDEDGAAPADNPFVGQTGADPRIWAYGLRNPWRFSFDRDTGDLWLGDVGQGSWEEIDRIVNGGNYGWRLFEGFEDYNNPMDVPLGDTEAPVHAYGRSLGRSVTGGYLYRGAALPSFHGAYLYADFVTGRVWALVHDGDQVVSNTQVANMPNPASFGEDAAGEIYVCSFDGRIYEFSENGGAPPAGPPALLSDTGLFADTAALQAAPGVIEYAVNAEAWADGARARRWMALPGTSRIGFHPTEAWEFAVGTVLAQHLEIDTGPGITRRLELRVLVRESAGWRGYTYKWDALGSDAALVAEDGETETLSIDEPGGVRQQEWEFPARADCLSCHNDAAGRVLGLRTRQVNRDFAYPGGTDNQLRAWNRIGLFDEALATPATYERLPDPRDDAAAVAPRVRAYLAVNCAQCHRPGGPTPVDMDFRYGIPDSAMNAIGVPAVNGDGLRIDAADPTAGEVWIRMAATDETRMPPVASHHPDPYALSLLEMYLVPE